MIKTQNIPSELFVQKNGKESTFEQSKESFLKAFKDAHQQNEQVIENSKKDSDTDLVVEDSNAENLEGETEEVPMVLWLPNTFVFENVSSELKLEQTSASNEKSSESASLNEIKNFQKNEVEALEALHLPDEKTVETFKTILSRSDFELFMNNSQTKQTNSKVGEVHSEESAKQGVQKPKEENLLISEKELVKNPIGRLDKFSKENHGQVKGARILDVPSATESVQFAQNISKLPQTIRSIIDEEYVGFKESAPDGLSEIKLADAETTDKLPQEMLKPTTEKSSGINEKNYQVENSLPKTDTFEFKPASEGSINTEFVSPAKQTTQGNQSAAKVEFQQPVKVPAEQWVQKVEAIILEQVDGHKQADKIVTTRLQLTPEKLGEMAIELVIQNKELTARIVVEHTETKEWLEQKVRQLSTTLATQDIQVNDFQVVVANQQHGMLDTDLQDHPFFKQKEERSRQEGTFKKEPEEEVVVEDDYSKKTSSDNGRLSIWV